MSDTKYLILEQHIFGHNVKDVWTVKFANITRDKAFEKMVALDTLNDKDHIIYHLVNTNDLWQKPKEEKPLILKDEVKQNSGSEDIPF